MHRSNLRKVGGSVMMTLPPAILDELSLSVGTEVGLAVADGCLTVKPTRAPRYTLEELLAQCDATAELDPEEIAWLSDGHAGDEAI